MNPTDTWTIVNTKHDAHSLGQHNSVFTVSNGYLGLKGNVLEDRDGYCPVTLINGVYDELDMFSLIRASNEERRYLDARHFDSAGKSPAVANLPNPLAVRVFVGGVELSLSRGDVRDFVQSLNLTAGVYRYACVLRDRHGRSTRIDMSRFASITHPHRAYMRYAVTPVDHDEPIRILAGIDGRTFSNTTRERQFAVTSADAIVDEPQGASPVGRCRLDARTPARGHDIHVRIATTCRRGRPAAAAGVVEHDAAFVQFEFAGARGECIELERAIVLASSEDARYGGAIDADAELANAAADGYDGALARQQATWQALWRRADVQIDGDDRAQRYLRFCLYHLMAAAPRHTDRLSVPVKLLTGEYYQGNTFYDSDLYIVPFYTFTDPDLARTYLNWRCVGLGPGREIALGLGYAGAKLAWQAGPRGEECLGRWWQFTHTNIHINADAVYALQQYVRATGDEAYLHERGIDLLVEAARFYASRAECDLARDAYHLRRATGPDEGHVAVTDDFYTNYLAQRTLRWAAEAIERARDNEPAVFAACRGRLGLGDDEPRRWREVADKLTFLFDPRTKVYEQCEGFYLLKPVPPRLDRQRSVWFETVFPYQALNQPDVAMVLVLFRDEFADDVRRANWAFYKDKSMNFSSMSFVLNSIMAADMGEMDDAYNDFVVSAGMDVDEDLTGRRDTYAGLHGTAAGGAWMAAVFGFGGVCLDDQGLRINPNLPPAWTSMRFPLAYRGRRLDVAINRDEIEITVTDGPSEPLAIRVAGRDVTVAPDAPSHVRYRDEAPV